jgi:hypothetical protein
MTDGELLDLNNRGAGTALIDIAETPRKRSIAAKQSAARHVHSDESQFTARNCGGRVHADQIRKIQTPMIPVISNQSKVMLIAVEFGGEWRFSMRPAPGVDLIMVVQVVDEEPLAFARRFLRKVLAVLDCGTTIVTAALAVARVFDVRHLEARCVIARTLLRTFRYGDKSQLHLAEPRGATPDCRSQLAAIAEGLLEGSTTDSEIRVGSESYGGTGAIDRGADS